MAQGHQTRRIIGADRSKVNGGPIAQDDDLVDIARESLDSNGLSRPPRDLSLDAHGARPSKRSVKLVDGLGWRRFIDTLFLPVETSGGGCLDSAVGCRWID